MLGVVSGAARGKPFWQKVWENRLMWLMLLPGITFIIIFAYIPMAGIITAFKDYKNQLGIWGSAWVGFDNFRYLFISGKLWQLIRNTLSYNVAFITLGMVCEVGFAVIISELPFRRLKKTFQSFTFLPFFISWVVVAAIMMNIFGYETGVLNTIITSFGGERVNIYGNPAKFPLVLVLLRLWKSTGYGCIIYLASITGMDQEILEAAEIDGANIWQRIWHITIAWIRPTMVIMLLLAIGSVFRGDFGMFYQITGRSQQLLEVSDIMDTYVYRSLMSSPNIGMSAAAGLFQSVLCFVSILLANYLVKRIEPDYTLF
ncbi:MAG: ABC transporter permease subunit [Treponema sp.]|jgi:putative aldouronate transport system permease protein|nr:ABC transporter permease subunit [Treponema sp.]